MIALFKKELRSFFSSLTAYLVLFIFLLINGMFLWIFKNEMNIFDSNYAGLDGFFFISPWVLMFLVAAITMKMFSEEIKSGTFELLLTHPMSDFQIVISKYLASLLLVLFSLTPTLVYFLTVYLLGSPIGNIDIGATWGAYIGLFLLAAIYGSVGIFVSSITENQIISYLVTVLICFILFSGFEYLSEISLFKNMRSTIVQIGINEHYHSISRGVIDFRDIIYYISVSGFFLYITKLSIGKRRR